MRIVVDMNLTPRWVDVFQQAEIDSAHWSNLGDIRASDAEIMSWARTNEYAVLTNDLDFPQLLAHTGASGPSILLLRGEPLTPEERAAAVLMVLRDRRPAIEAGAIVSFDWSETVRIRLLPLSKANS